jgi:hypothetical protein
MIVTLRGASSKGHENTYGGVAAKGVGLDVGLSVQIPAGQTANGFQVEQPDGTAIAGFDSGGALMLTGNVASKLYTALVQISAANITDTGAGHLGNAGGYPLVVAPGAAYGVEFVSAVMSYTYATAAYTAGGNITVNLTGGSALTGVVSNANSLAAASSNVTQFVPLATAGITVTANTGLSLVAAVAFTQPGTAAGTVKVYVTYRVHLL